MVKRVSERERTWAIERVLTGDGSRGAANVLLKKGHYYASSTMTGGHESFWEVDIDSMRLSARGGSTVSFAVRTGSAMSRSKSFPKGKPTARISKGHSKSEMRRVLREVVKKFCNENPGFAVILGGPGARDGNEPLKAHTIEIKGEIFMRAVEGQCVAAAMINAVDALKGPSEAKLAAEYLGEKNPQYLRLSSCADDMHKICRGCRVRKVPKSVKKEFNEDRFLWLGRLERGVWIVRLVRQQESDHCLVVDGLRKLIIDSSEQYPLRLCEEALRLCGGDGENELEVAEVLEVYMPTLNESRD